MQTDYIQKLSPKEKEWLAAFNEAHYGHNPDCLEKITDQKVTVHERRRLWRELKHYERRTADDKSYCCSYSPGIEEFFLDKRSFNQEDVTHALLDEKPVIELSILESIKSTICKRFP